MKNAPAYDLRADTLPYSTRDIAEALPEFLMARAGHYTPENPIAADMLLANCNLHHLARNYVTGWKGEPPHLTTVRAMGSSDLGIDLVKAWAVVALTRFDESTAGVRRIMDPVPVPKFTPARIPSLSMSDFAAVPEFSDFPMPKVQVSDPLEAAAAVTTQGASLVFSRQAQVNGELGLFTRLVQGLANQAALALAKSVALAIEDTSSLDDGTPMYSTTATIANLATTGQSVNLTALDEAIAKLYRQPTPAGSIAGVSPAFVVVPPELAATAYVSVLAAFGDSTDLRPDRVSVVVLPHLTSTTAWWLMGDPVTAPVLGLLTLEGARSMLTIEQAAAPQGIDGLCLKARLDYRVVRMQRTGIFKNPGA